MIHKEKPPKYNTRLKKYKEKAESMPKHAGRLRWDGKNPEDVIAKLEYAWSCGCNDSEAALYAEVSPSSLCRYLQANPDISQRAQELKNNPILKAKEAILKGLLEGQDAHQFALKLLERVRPKEYAPTNKNEVSGADGGPVILKWDIPKND